MDEVWWQNTVGSLPSEEETKEKETEESGFSAPIESQLEDIVISSWENIPKFKDLEILQEDGEYIGQQYDTKEVGRIDLLCKDKKTGDFVIVVGQTLRYMGWVKKNLAKEGQNVCGLIITFEGDPDSRLKYSLEPIKDLIELKFYKISITIS